MQTTGAKFQPITLVAGKLSGFCRPWKLKVQVVCTRWEQMLKGDPRLPLYIRLGTKPLSEPTLKSKVQLVCRRWERMISAIHGRRPTAGVSNAVHESSGSATCAADRQTCQRVNSLDSSRRFRPGIAPPAPCMHPLDRPPAICELIAVRELSSHSVRESRQEEAMQHSLCSMDTWLDA